jgi:hypothetical protein
LGTEEARTRILVPAQPQAALEANSAAVLAMPNPRMQAALSDLTQAPSA